LPGNLEIDGKVTPDPMRGLSTEPVYFDVELPPGAMFQHRIAGGLDAFVYTNEG
jgi:redox-sensitive bicupin YhaK (pirin superfamily)